MKIELAVKVAAFCRELGGSDLPDLALGHDMGAVFQEAADLLKAGAAGPDLESRLDALDAMVRTADGKGLFPSTTRRGPYPGSLPGAEADSGAQWWVCPHAWCIGQGRVRAGQQAPVCAASGKALAPGPLPR